MDLSGKVAIVTGSCGWSADATAEAWPRQFADSQQTVGHQFPERPE